MNFNEILYGVAYYDEYMPYDRIETDFKMIRDAGMNVIDCRIHLEHMGALRREYLILHTCTACLTAQQNMS